MSRDCRFDSERDALVGIHPSFVRDLGTARRGFISKPRNQTTSLGVPAGMRRRQAPWGDRGVAANGCAVAIQDAADDKRPPIGKTAVGDDGVRPTEYQIKRGTIVLPRVFYEGHVTALDWWGSFDVVALGRVYEALKLDTDRRINIKLRDLVQQGDVLRLHVAGGKLHFTKTEQDP